MGIARDAEHQKLHGPLVIIRFQDERIKIDALEQSPVGFGRKMLMLQPCTHNKVLRKEDFKNVPIWIHLPGLGMQYYAKTALEKLVSLIGSPLFADKRMVGQEKLVYARICVEVEAGVVLPKEINFLNEEDEVVHQPAIYERILTQSGMCKVFGHNQFGCSHRKIEIVQKEVYVVTGRVFQLGENNSIKPGRYVAEHTENNWHPNLRCNRGC